MTKIAAEPLDWLAVKLLAWFDRHGRKSLPWQRNPTPYSVWVSEIMLQQTQVQVVVPYFEQFMARFPDVHALAVAELDEVLHYWSGLGYYARARNLHKSARLIAASGGAFPDTGDELQALPGVGRSTAGAILALAMGRFGVILDGNVKRVLERFHGIDGRLTTAAARNALWALAEAHTPRQRTAAYTQGVMDLGATLCVLRSPQCVRCPLAERCEALATDRVEELPAKAKCRQKPVRKARMFVISTAAGACLLERRPEIGLWGGLWTPPQRRVECSPESVCQEFGIRQSAIRSHRLAPVFRHSLTHFHLDIEPHYLRLDDKPHSIGDSEGRMWYEPEGSQAVGLSAPSAILIAAIEETWSTPD